MLQSAAVSARDAVLAFLDRISRVDGRLNAIPTLVAERALAEADVANLRVG
jgi:Asp-tRNA(Asn)/Glu-tRNA(Gln) amidotransferase A subunit family amidase